MSTTFPTTLDNWTNPGATTEMDDTGFEHDLLHAHAFDAIEAIEAKVGVDGSNVTTSLDYIVKAAWVAYTPAWTASTTNPTLGNGTITGAYKIQGRTLFTRIHLTMGSTTTFGAGRYSFSLPGAAVAVAARQVVSAVCMDASPVAYYPCVAFIDPSGSTFARIAEPAGSNGVSPTAPFTWAQDDQLVIEGAVELTTVP